MKKVYAKPEIVFEDFSLCASIAVGCEVKTNLPTYERNCGIQVGGDRGSKIVFLDPNMCTHPQSNEKYDTFCYHIPSEDQNLFNS